MKSRAWLLSSTKSSKCDNSAKLMKYMVRWSYGVSGVLMMTKSARRNALNILRRSNTFLALATQHPICASHRIPRATVDLHLLLLTIDKHHQSWHTIAGLHMRVFVRCNSGAATLHQIHTCTVAVPLWTFRMINVYGQTVVADACIIDGCTERDHEVIIPFRTTDDKVGSTVATVRLVSAAILRGRAVRPVSVAVAAPDGEEGIFVPTVNHGAVLFATAETKVNNGRVLVPAINASGRRMKLPGRKELGI
ncbi:LOW QUALITY PROTEIN: hypothetical protein PHMEG_0006878 [Phytophthora megakarya]|uniref:Uncharacterized protein n=1 Tax=Phytophthora megakarya TaxID=4795 RepID=A0A225WPM7_9STRA|nr:LOW QUALITY PROTEIN: hypothetical protein PHMEG_0006878 [Phytophthora megakarya]